MLRDYTPDRDASLGLVFRLNNLWAQTDFFALKGDYDKWNNVLDRIYCNLLYRNDMEIEESKSGEILKIELSTKDKKIYNILSKGIQIAKNKYMRGPLKNKSLHRSVWYHSIQKKDIRLRKDMMKLGLYLKENKMTPGSALFGDFGKRK